MPTFRTLRVSDPEFERDGLRHVVVKSAALGRRASCVVFVPPGLAPGTPVNLAILLHGVYGSETSWSLTGGAHLAAQRMMDTGRIGPLILAMPSDGLYGDGSGYLQRPEGDFEKWITEEVPEIVRLVVPDSPINPRMGIAGLSMGGFGALRLGARNGHLFGAAAGMSAITRLSEMEPFVEETMADVAEAAQHPSVLEAILANQERLPRIRFDCGTEDELMTANRLLHRQLEEAEIQHEFKENAGSHEWAYWKRHLPEVLLFLNGSLG